ncbi:tRNA (guanosine(37)-N1)-methyltransferase TrmD [Mycoplasmopsis synoviae]|uniref:tRNA (guanosine(37)-N1)-methyltransferase TrmD n=1 Tax=Mycoplasmopsis synoviae TaxID=2109 RepID=UPI000CA1A4A3|nr:tRNA (guanosine(37)-N1)-methyltransferase TrmD [Mycoplasmopsis synoviae]AKJ20934.1 tRNA (Guanine37-N1) -methyltransferase [Mycoplasmopsis synoviae]AWL83856.1 tRNA (guanosine(37)-N1)-methyltransferase TrmD [Mycoplasmopsis synoviae]UZF64336.1 tRNA (guanosine(37)-N1)-methyltransferase TrmD [Mycoplasmopsis synoviae]UZF65007.1 tRNA (guanosine(37)-N1)-methyltransferase TrmD [Mycoplasmopsis synoviae]UZF65679.1 tRNA (guanosine(37)-N1)-methyltransferase TrmD [Mycoplasmopsis synoviae]
MKINFLTLFPRYFEPLINESIIKKAVDKKILEFNVVDFRDFTKSKHRKVDDEIYGGGHGLLLQVEPIDLALDSLENRGGYKILVTPQGKIFDQKMANKLAKYDQITLISGRYEGFDERVTYLVDEEISIGDYVLTGGELPAMIIADSICRLVPGVIKKESVENDSFQNEGLLDYPQYTRPREYKNMKVPEVLFNGNHKEISEWKLKAQLEKTKKNRPDILERIKNEK